MKTAWNRDRKTIAGQEGVRSAGFSISCVLKEIPRKEIPILTPLQHQ